MFWDLPRERPVSAAVFALVVVASAAALFGWLPGGWVEALDRCTIVVAFGALWFSLMTFWHEFREERLGAERIAVVVADGAGREVVVRYRPRRRDLTRGELGGVLAMPLGGGHYNRGAIFEPAFQVREGEAESPFERTLAGRTDRLVIRVAPQAFDEYRAQIAEAARGGDRTPGAA
ncbi:hypothetical protein [Alienimonas californiensis]|uniref:hypothetical protein n=1 Tax=Alienimonas californiensis TaxID=2527989 RepID=UPI0011A1A8B4|nr:hypothetical protein [Alienimonas californiensis]